MDHTFSHTWINDYDLPETYFEDLTFDHVSMKWDVLTRYGVLSVGDVLEITFDTPDANGQKVFMDAEVSLNFDKKELNSFNLIYRFLDRCHPKIQRISSNSTRSYAQRSNC